MVVPPLFLGVCVDGCKHLHTWMWRPEVDLSVFLYCAPLYFEAGSLLSLKFLRLCLALFPSLVLELCLAFLWVLGV